MSHDIEVYFVFWDSDIAEVFDISHIQSPIKVPLENSHDFHVFLDLDTPLSYDLITFNLATPNSCIQLVVDFHDLALQEIYCLLC